jgi:hypothetical protein
VVLKRRHDLPRAVGDAVEFVMEDVRTGGRVTCQITIEALRRWFAGYDPVTNYPGDGLAFFIHRDAIEEAANHTYLRGEKAPRLT